MTDGTVIGLTDAISSSQSGERDSRDLFRHQRSHTSRALASKAIASIAQKGYALAPAAEMQALLCERGLKDWDGFSASWDNLPTDAFMGDGGKYRRRRYAEFAVSRDGIARKPHGPHYQSCAYNSLNGGIERWFEPIDEAIAWHPALQAVLQTGHSLFDLLTPASVKPYEWHAEVHQFRIIAGGREEGHPTPEGMHRDGVDWALMLLVARQRVRFGKTTICDLRMRPLESFTLTTPLDTALVNDRRVYHEVTPVAALDHSDFGHRDMLVVTFSRYPQRRTTIPCADS